MDLTLPAGQYTISQLFGANPSMYKRFGMAGHNGVDVVGMPRNYCLAEGDFYSNGYDENGYGNWVKIKDRNGFIWTYAHFAHPVTVRGHIAMFQDLGEMGTTGYSTGVHCHVGVKPPIPNQHNGFLGSIDPLPMILDNIKNYNPPTNKPNYKRMRIAENETCFWVKAKDQKQAEFWIVVRQEEYPQETRRRVKAGQEKFAAFLFGSQGKLERCEWPRLDGLAEGKEYDFNQRAKNHPELFESVN